MLGEGPVGAPRSAGLPIAAHPSVTLPGMRALLSRSAAVLCLAVAALLALAPAALAADGVGIYGRTDDKVVTFFAFGLMAFFTILVIGLSLIQIRLENRKQRRKEDLERLGQF
jgi:hypothetical protein